MSNQIGTIPAFTPGGESKEEEVKEGEGTPAETSTVEKPAEETEVTGEEEAVKPTTKEVVSEDTDVVAKQIQGLKEQKDALLEEIKSLRGERREVKQAQVMKLDEKISEELNDVAPEDVQVIEKILRAKGYITKDEAKNITYEDVKTQEVDKFLAKYPEFKPENDTNDIRWNSLNKVVSQFKRPDDPRQIGQLLEMARKLSAPVQSTGGRDIVAIKKQVKDTAIGSGGMTRSSNLSSLTDDQIQIYRNGGWTDEEISNIASKK